MPYIAQPFPAIADDLAQIIQGAERTLATLDSFALHSQFDVGSDAERDLNDRIQASGESMAYYIQTTIARLSIYSDALSLPSLLHLLHSWQAKWNPESWTKIEHWSNSDAEGHYSQPFSELRPLAESVMVLTRPINQEPPPLQHQGLSSLVFALRSLAKIARERKVKIKREHDLQELMHSHLSGIFPDYVKSPSIPKPIVKFNADGGVLSLKAAIECKIIESDVSVRTAIHGLTEDVTGYAGSSEWQHFFSVCYMNDAYAVEGQFDAALGASGHARKWTTILLTGSALERSKT